MFSMTLPWMQCCCTISWVQSLRQHLISLSAPDYLETRVHEIATPQSRSWHKQYRRKPDRQQQSQIMIPNTSEKVRQTTTKSSHTKHISAMHTIAHRINSPQQNNAHFLCSLTCFAYFSLHGIDGNKTAILFSWWHWNQNDHHRDNIINIMLHNII